MCVCMVHVSMMRYFSVTDGRTNEQGDSRSRMPDKICMHVLYLSVFICSCNFSSRPPRPSPSSTRLRLVELGLGLSGLEWSQRWSTSCNFSQVHLGQVEVQLGFASLDFNLASMDLIGVCGGSPRATPMKSNVGPVEVQLGFASLDFNLTEIGLHWSCTR